MSRGKAGIHKTVQDDLCVAVKLVEWMDLDARTPGIGKIAELAREVRLALERAYAVADSEPGSSSSS